MGVWVLQHNFYTHNTQYALLSACEQSVLRSGMQGFTQVRVESVRFPKPVSEIAVGISLARYPPRRPGRALISASGSYLG